MVTGAASTSEVMVDGLEIAAQTAAAEAVHAR